MKSFLVILAISIGISTGCSSATESRTEIEYGSIQVPENRNDPDSRELNISYVYIPKSGNSKKPPIIFLQGGPGGSSLAMQGFFSNIPLRRNHDIILFDARGTGQSDANCVDAGAKFMDLMAQDLSVEGEYEGTLEICETCKDELEEKGVDLAGYNSLENAADVEALREHLGIDKWILLGGSYGTRLGLTYLREYDAAEAAILMGIFPPEINIYEGFVEGLDGSLNYLFAMCANDSECNTRYPNLKSTFIATIEKLRAEPKTISFDGKDFVINAQDALLLIHQMLYSRTTIQRVPSFIKALQSEETGELARSIRATAGRLAVINAATYWSVQASEEVQFNKEASIEKDLIDYPYLQPGPAFFATDQRILEEWHSFRSDAKENKRVRTKTPLLITNGLFDPITPITNARSVMDYLLNATLVEFPFDGHGTFNSCFFDVIDEFVSNGYEIPDISCASRGSLNWQ